MNKQDHHHLFVELLTRHQSELYGYIYAVVRNWEDADDLYQSVCVVLWSKFESFQYGSSFFAWARQTAKIKISEFLRHKRSRRHITEGQMDALDEIAAESYDDEADAYLVALRHCRDKLNSPDDELLQLRYVQELNIVEIADRLHRLRPSVSRSLNRIRGWLFKCIEMELVKQDHSRRDSDD